MELSSNVLKTLKCLSGSYENKPNFTNETYTILIKIVFDSFIINLKKGNFELTLDTKTFGQFKFFCNISNVFYNFEQIESSGK